MQCEHCCFRCTKKGKDISRAHFDAALSMVGESEFFDVMTIGGGEPTLHKNCMDFVWQSVRQCLTASANLGISAVGIVTNGSVTKKALELALMAQNGLVSARLSYDRYHNIDMVDDRVRRAFKAEKLPSYDSEYNKRENDFRAINQWEYFITPHGRALDNGIYNHPIQGINSCCCEGIFVTPDGTIWQCGCREKVLGHLDNPKAFLEIAHPLRDNDNYEIPCSKKS